jgi:NADPH:quinone reductase-like Zn-dependent oxidoreductase
MTQATTPHLAASVVSQLHIQKANLQKFAVVTVPERALLDGEIRVRVEQFSFTANNITYAAFGELMNYWGFYPSGVEGEGVIPVWGFGSVVQSGHPGVAVGERLYGYWPMGTQAILQPIKLTEAGFSDGTEHRKGLHPVYNGYTRVNKDPFYTADSEDIQSLMRPLFTTAFLIDDFFADNQFFGAKKLLLSSASSKTAYGTAHQLFKREGVEVIGLTSKKNRAFCESLGCYHKVIAYDELDSVDANAACAYIDFAGNSDLRLQVHTRFKNLSYSCSIGGTHVNELGGAKSLPGPKAILFFAPAQIKKRYSDWGAEGFGKQLFGAWRGFCKTVQTSNPPWLQVKEFVDVASLVSVYQEVLVGQSDPRLGNIVRLKF